MTVPISKERRFLFGLRVHQSSRIKDVGFAPQYLDKKELWVQANTGKAVVRVNQSKVRRDHDEWHDVSIPALDDENPENLREDHELYVDAEFGEQSFFLL